MNKRASWYQVSMRFTTDKLDYSLSYSYTLRKLTVWLVTFAKDLFWAFLQVLKLKSRNVYCPCAKRTNHIQSLPTWNYLATNSKCVFDGYHRNYPEN